MAKPPPVPLKSGEWAELAVVQSNSAGFSVGRFVGRINVYNDLNDPVVR